MFTSSFIVSEQEHRQWTPYKHGAPSASPTTAFVTPVQRSASRVQESERGPS
jgi:hypothetical protein